MFHSKIHGDSRSATRFRSILLYVAHDVSLSYDKQEFYDKTTAAKPRDVSTNRKSCSLEVNILTFVAEQVFGRFVHLMMSFANSLLMAGSGEKKPNNSIV